MILVTLGTQDKSFVRLLNAVEKAVQEKKITDRVVVQAGYTSFHSDDMEIMDYIPEDHFTGLIEEASLIITHGGVGTIMTALKHHKKILAAARLSEYQEHTNDHQTQLLESFAEKGYLIYMKDLSDIGPYLKQAETFTPKSYISNTSAFISVIQKYIDTH